MPGTNIAANSIEKAPAEDAIEEIIKDLKTAGLKQVASTSKENKIEVEISADGSVNLNWWTPAGADLACSLCEKTGTRDCIYCMNTNPWCG